MSRRLRIFICCILVLFAFGAGIFAYAHTRWAQDDAAIAEEGLPTYLVDKDGKIRVPVEPATGDPRNSRGTADNPFFILEIVPYDGMAEFGYQIYGCEPIDVDAVARDKQYDILSNLGAYYDINYTETVFRFWPEDQPSTFTASVAATTLNQYGTMTYVGAGNGQYNIEGVSEEDLESIDKKAATYVAAAGGAFSWKPLSAEECFAMTTAEAKAPYEGQFTGALTVGTSFKMYFADMTYVEGTGFTVTHKNTFLKESVGLKYAFDADGVRYELPEAEVNERIKAYKSVVYTVTPEDLNMNPELIDRADLIVISPKMNNSLAGCPDGMYTYLQPGDTDLSDGKYKYIPYIRKHLFGYEEPEGQYGRKENKPGATFKTNLLDWSIVVKIAGRAMDETHILPVVMENKIFQNAFSGSDADALNMSNVKMKVKYADGSMEQTQNANGTQENMAKLYMMLCQMKSSTFTTLYGNPADASNVWFSSQNFVLSKGTPSEHTVQMKNGAVLQTGVFHYDNGRPTAQQGTSDSRVYWSDLTLLPWHLLPTSGYSSPSDYSTAMVPFGIAVHGGVGHNMTSGDAQNSIRNGLMGFDNQGQLNEGLHTMDSGVRNGVFGAQVYEYFDTINGSAPMPTQLTAAECLFYLINGVNGGPTPAIDTTQYKILELQPSAIYESTSNPMYWKLFILAHTNSVADPVVEEMTTSEFIGSHVECISEYDLIYVGMNKWASDPTMDFPSGTTDFVYAHTGPKVEVGTTFSALYGWLRSGEESGLSPAQYNAAEKYFTYSGNDLTNLTFKKLQEYNEAGFPIVFGDGFFSSYQVPSNPSSTYVMAGTIDRNSNIYKLGDMIDDAGSKEVYMGELAGNSTKATLLIQTLTSNSKKVEMVFSESPVLYDSNKPDIRDRYINGYDDTNRTLRYKFYVKAPAGTDYQVKLYVDTNTDGAYTAGKEDIGATVTDIYGATVAGGVVQAGRTYIVERQIDNRIGSLSWKLDLVRDNKVYASESGVSAILKGSGDSQVDIKVLQIVPEPVIPGKTYTPDDPKCVTSLTLPMDADHLNELEANGASGTARTFSEKLTELQALGLFVEFVVMDQTQVLAAMDAEPDYLYKNYDMLVLGFADIYKGVSAENLITEIETFITRGKAVLYTHDTSSGIGNSGTDSLPVWGKNVTIAYRDLFGMDRYGARAYYLSGDLPDVSDGKDTPYIPANATDPVEKVYTNAANNHASGKTLLQGVSDGILYRALYPENSESASEDKNINSYQINRVNTGAITNYPYTIPDSIAIASTHPQYYQLDMEQKDIVVWYTLDGGNGATKLENKYFGVLNDDDEYIGSKNDVRNNYYIYNKGNVTYSGMGHMKWDGTENSLNLQDWEIKLFINTFVAAYRAPAVGVPVEVVNDDVTRDSSGKRYLCVDVDSSDATEIIGIDIVDSYRLMVPDGAGYAEAAEVTAKSKRVYFRLNDTNAFGNNVDYKLSMKVDGTDMMLAVYKKTGEFMHGKSDDRKLKANAEYNEVYYVDVPIHMDTIGTKSVAGKTVLEVMVDLTYYIGSQPFPGVPKTTTIEILPRGLYDLN